MRSLGRFAPLRQGIDRVRVPLALGGLCLLAYGLFIPWLGYYWDDWPPILVGEVAGFGGFPEYFGSDRPLTVWPAAPLSWLLGSTTVAWHAWVLLTRWVMGVAAWSVVRQIWPDREVEAFAVATLFMISPAFSGQPMAVVFSVGLTSFALFVGSLALSLKAVSTQARTRLVYHAVAFATFALSVTPEIFVPLEMLRPLLVFILLGRLGFERRRQLRATFVHWAPFVLLVAAFASWRAFVFEPTRRNFEAVVFENLLRDPMNEISTLFDLVRHDLWLGIGRAWARPFLDVANAPFGSEVPEIAVLVAMGLAVAVITWSMRLRFVTRVGARDSEGDALGSQEAQRRWGRSAVLMGFIATLLAGVPWWVSHRSGELAPRSDPIYLPMSLGAALLVVGCVAWVRQGRVVMTAAVLVLAVPAVAFHIDMAAQHADDWEEQRSFATQLGVLAGDLSDDTAVVLDGSAFLVSRSYATGSMAALMYGGSRWDGETIRPRVWAFDSNRDLDRAFDFEEGSVTEAVRSIAFSASFDDLLVVRYRPPGCLRLFDRHWREMPDLSDAERAVGALSRPERIVSSAAPSTPPGFVGEGPITPWCELFVPAQRLAAFDQWAGVSDLADEARAQGLEAGETSEWLIYAEAYLREGRAADAAAALSNAEGSDRQVVCTFVQRISEDRTLDGRVVARVIGSTSLDECVS